MRNRSGLVLGLHRLCPLSLAYTVFALSHRTPEEMIVLGGKVPRRDEYVEKSPLLLPFGVELVLHNSL